MSTFATTSYDSWTFVLGNKSKINAEAKATAARTKAETAKAKAEKKRLLVFWLQSMRRDIHQFQENIFLKTRR